MSNMELKAAVEDLAKKLGKPEARRLLVIEGLSPHTADKIMGGRYQSEMGPLVRDAIRRAIVAADKAAS